MRQLFTRPAQSVFFCFKACTWAGTCVFRLMRVLLFLRRGLVCRDPGPAGQLAGPVGEREVTIGGVSQKLGSLFQVDNPACWDPFEDFLKA